jgi:CRP/FNR family transcriptional regulator, cyclic AMP receptor protein
MQKSGIIEKLSQSALFGGLDPVVLSRVIERMHSAKFSAREVLFARGEPGKALFFILSGRVRLSVVSEEGRELAFRQAAEGEVIGEIAVLDGGQRSADATAIANLDVLSLARKDLMDLIAAEPALQANVIQFLCQRLRDTSLQLEMIALMPIEARVARLFLAMIQQSGASASGKHTPLALNLSQGEIAMLLGASRPKVNIALSELEGRGALKRMDGGFLCHREKLSEIAQDAGE